MSRAISAVPIKAAAAEDIGRGIVSAFTDILQQDLSVQRVHNGHALVMKALHQTHPNLHLYTFGSTAVYGFHESTSDVDFVVLSDEDILRGKDEDSTSQIAKSVQADVLAKLAHTLRREYVGWHVEEVRRARVPVIRIKSKNLDFDVTAHRRNGVRNSALLRAYFNQQPMLRWLSMAVKRWSKKTGMNGPMGFLTSYGFNILLVYFCLHGGVLGVPPPGGAAFQGLRFVPPETHDVARIDPLPGYLALERPDEKQLGQLALIFADYYLDTFDVDKHVVTLSREGITTKDELGWTKTAEDMKNINNEKIAYRLCIEDPYEINLNVGRNVTPFKLDVFKKHLQLARGNGFLTL